MNKSTELSIYDAYTEPAQLAEVGRAIMHSGIFGAKNASQGMILALEAFHRRMPILKLAEKYHLIHGNLSMRADAMLAGFHEQGGDHVIVTRDSGEAKIQLIDKDKTYEFSLTWADALNEPFVYEGKEKDVAAKLYAGNRDGLKIKAKYQTPRGRMQMLWARVVSDGVRAVKPGVVTNHYTPEEIGDFDGHDDAIDVEAEVVPAGDTGPAPAQTVEPAAAAAPPDAQAASASSSGGKPGVRLDGKSDPAAINDSDPCGREMGSRISQLARSIEMPLEVFRGILAKHGVSKPSELTYRDAVKLMAKLRQRASGEDIPF